MSLDITPSLIEFANHAHEKGLTPLVSGSYALVGYRHARSEGTHYYCVNTEGVVTDSHKGIVLRPDMVIRLVAGYQPVTDSRAVDLVENAIESALSGRPRTIEL